VAIIKSMLVINRFLLSTYKRIEDGFVI